MGVLQILLEKGANVAVHNSKKLTPLHVVVGTSNAAIMHLLLESGAGIEVLDDRRRTPLH